MVKCIRKWKEGDPYLDEFDWNDMVEVLQDPLLSHNHKGGACEGVQIDHADLVNVLPDQHHAVHVKTLADHPLSIIPTMDDAHIPDVDTLSYGNPFAVPQIPNLPASKITSERFGMPRMPDGTDKYVLTAKGAGIDPSYNILPIKDGDDILEFLTKHLGVWWFNNNWLPTGMIVYSTSGSDTIAWDDLYVGVGTGTTVGGTSIVYKRAYGLSGANSWNKRRFFGLYVRFVEVANLYCHLVTGLIMNASTIDNLANHIGFKLINGTLYATVANNTNETAVPIGTPLADSLHRLEVDFEPTIRARFWYDGSLVATIVTNLPAGVTNSEYMLNASMYNVTTGVRRCRIFESRTFQRA